MFKSRDVCKTKNIGLFSKVHIFEYTKSRLFTNFVLGENDCLPGIQSDYMVPVADPGGQGSGPPTPVKTRQKKMAAAPRRKFRESSGPPRKNFWIHY